LKRRAVRLLAITFFMALFLPVIRFFDLADDAPGRIGKASERAKRKRGQKALALASSRGSRRVR